MICLRTFFLELDIKINQTTIKTMTDIQKMASDLLALHEESATDSHLRWIQRECMVLARKKCELLDEKKRWDNAKKDAYYELEKRVQRGLESESDVSDFLQSQKVQRIHSILQ